MSDFSLLPVRIRQVFADMAGIAYDLEVANILAFDLSKCEHASMPFLLIGEASTFVQRRAVVEKIALRLKQEYNLRAYANSVQEQALWLLLDYGEFATHIFAPEARKFYNLEGLWSNYPSYAPDFTLSAGAVEVKWRVAESGQSLRG